MKKIVYLIFAAAVFFSSCQKDVSESSNSSFSGITSTSDINVPANFDWRTTKIVSVDVSTLAGDYKSKIQVKDMRGNVLLYRVAQINLGDKLYFSLPKSDKEVSLINNGIEDVVKVNGKVGTILEKKAGGYPSNAPCPCDGRMENVTFKYLGTNGATLTVWYKDKGNSKSLSHTFANLTFGDIISVNGFDSKGNSGKPARLKSQTFLSTNNGGSYWNVHTSCSEYILGNIYGPFEVIGFTDGQSRTCSSSCVDTDGDGCCDSEDAFPNDPSKCDIQYIPGENVYGSYAYEDLWPSTGDFDFNDKVIDRTTALILDGNGDVIEAEHKFVLRAAGAGYKNGFGFSMPSTTPGEISNVTSSYPNPGVYTQIDGKGLEMNQTQAVVILYENWNHVVAYSENGKFFNTVTPGSGISAGVGHSDTITVTVEFSVPQVITDVLEIDPFVIRNSQRDAEIHLPWFGPTDLANTSYFNTFKDASSFPGSGNNYVTANNIPWGIETPLSSFEWPRELHDIVTVYHDFAAWASTGMPADWYENGNRDASKVY
ncbi:LruC domain-containing protein [Owenweeksia hongkongensis]|uniref:LruC domain-containing protein n=1 Tax=Owenweeksia hongkongensis TaxID=253245 RepID=UPI003A8FEA96